MRKYEITHINFSEKGMTIGWKGSLGFGELAIRKNDSSIEEYEAYTEFISSNDDKEFISDILDSLKYHLVKIVDVKE